MKKIVALFLMGMMIFLTGCTGSTLTFTMPYGEIYNSVGFYERAEYTVLVVDGSVEEGEQGFLSTKKGEGALTFTAKLLGGGITRIDSELVIDYADGQESVVSRVEFNNKFEPTLSQKTVTVRDVTVDGKKVNNSYSLDVTYGTSEAKIKLTAFNANGINETTTKTIASSKIKGAVDNEMLYFATRAINGLGYGFSINYSLFNAYNFVKGGIERYSLSVACSRENEDLAVPKSIFDRAVVDSEQEANTLPAVKAQVGISAKQNGTPIMLYYSQAPLNFSQSGVTAGYGIDKVLLKIVTTDYDIAEKAISQKIIYTLNNYSIVE